MATSLQERLTQLTADQRSQLALKIARRGAAQMRAEDSSRLPQVVADPAQHFAPFPLTDVQQAYWIGRSGAFELGQVAAHAYLELEGRFDVPRLERALNQVIARHDMLRGVILPNGQQQVLKEVPPYRIEVTDLRGADAETLKSRLATIRDQMSHEVLPTDQYPLFHINASLLDAGRVRLHVSLDALIFDGWSIALFFRDWSRLYHDPDAQLPKLDLTFRDYVLAELKVEQTEAFARDRSYWLGLLEELPPPPDLPLAKAPTDLTSGRFHRRTGKLEAAVWARLKRLAARAGLTVTGLLLAAYAEVVALWSQSPRFIINVPRFNRLPLHPQVNEIIGEAASFSLIAVDVSGPDGFETRAKRVQQQLWNDLDHSLFGGVRVLRELSKLRGSGALCPVVFTSAPQDKDGRDAYATLVARDLGEVVTAINQTSQVWLDNHISEQDGALICDWDTVEELFPPGMSQDMFESYMRFLARLADDEAAWGMSWAQLAPDIVPPAQRERTRVLNAKTAPIPDALLQDLFAAQVPLRGDAPAVIDSRRTLSYRELDQLAHQWARRLRDAGIEPGRNVAVVMDKGWEQIVAVMAILRNGCAYVPIDSRQPAERRRYMLENSDAACAMVQSWVDEDRDWPAGLQRFQVDKEDIASTDATPLSPTRRPEDAAYVIYTSGSTGEPKGVVVAHRSVVNVVVCTNQAFGIGHTDRAFAVTVLHHDLSVYDVFGLLAAGGAIVLPDEAGRRDPAHWAELIRVHGVTIWNTVPAMMVMLLDYADGHPGAIPSTLRQVILGGDWVPVDVPRRLAMHNPCTKLLCIGGPTETTIWNIWYRADNVQPDWKSIPYGQPMANNSYHILGETMVPRPDWVPGEQYCGGDGLALGYWRDPAKTADKFVRHPLTGERLYRTGDLGRWLPDGNIEFIGRADFQVKINGQRIELGEIEAAIRRHPAVRAAIVATTERTGFGKRLAAYYVLQSGARLEAGELRAFLATVLPEAMVPSFYLALEKLPLTANGKVDRKSLPDPQPVSPPGVPVASAEAMDSVHAIVTRLVAGVLKLETINPEANLLAIGANSIDMVRIGNELEKSFGFRPRMDQIFRLQTARAIADYCEAQTGRKAAATADATTPVEEDWCSIVASFGNLIEPEERDAFKKSEPGIRRDDEGRPFVQLEPPMVDDALLARYRARKSHRTFSLKPIPLEQFGRMLNCLYQVSLDGKPKYLWPSPGGLYPIQVYLHIKAGRVKDLRAGTYYYHPVKHRLVGLTPDVEIDRSIHVPFVNTPVFDDAAFSIFLLSRLAAIAPSYGEASFAFARIEAGIIAALLEDAARQWGLGLCQIGGVDFDRIRPLFNLERSHLFVHSLLGGIPAGEAETGALGTGDAATARAAQLLARVRQLTPQEAKAMLEAMNNKGSP